MTLDYRVTVTFYYKPLKTTVTYSELFNSIAGCYSWLSELEEKARNDKYCAFYGSFPSSVTIVYVGK